VHTGPNGVKKSKILDFATAPKFASQGFSLWVADNRTQARDMYRTCVACVQCTKYIVGTPWSGLQVHTGPNGVKISEILDFATAPKLPATDSRSGSPITGPRPVKGTARVRHVSSARCASLARPGAACGCTRAQMASRNQQSSILPQPKNCQPRILALGRL
jgi:hypothetical protein